MALTCTAESLNAAAVCFGCGGLSTKQLRAISLYLKCQFINGNTNVTCTSESLLAAAVAAGFDKISEKQQLAIEAYLDCQIASSGGGGGGSNTQCGNYGGGQPNFTPATTCALAIDTSNDNLWAYTNGAWHQLV